MSTPPRPIKAANSRHGSIARSPFSTSYLSASPIAQESIERDLAECSDDEVEAPDSPSSEDESSESSTIRPDTLQHSFSNTYRRPSFVAFGAGRPAVTPGADPKYLTKKEKKQSRNEERSLLRDNHLAPPKHPEPPRRSVFNRLYRKLFSTKIPKKEADEETPQEPIFTAEPSETSALLGESARTHHERLNAQWEAAVAAGKIKTTWQREAKTLWRYSSPLVVTFVLQYSLTVASIFTVGHLGKVELGAVSLASMTANITGYAIYQGLATSLDTLCAQAYGSGKKHLVGLQLQRMVYFLWVLTIPIGIIWLSAEKILEMIVPEKESAQFAGLYLRILLIGAPGYAAFESGKRFVQAQGLFSATTYVLLIAAPLNAFMNWLFVWQFKWGFVGAPIAVVVTDNLLPVLLFLYVRFVDGRQCWNGFTKRALHNWGEFNQSIFRLNANLSRPNGQARSPRSSYGRSRVPCLRDSHSGIQLLWNYPLSSSKHSQYLDSSDVPDPVPDFHCSFHTRGKSDWSNAHICRKDERQSGKYPSLQVWFDSDNSRQWLLRHSSEPSMSYSFPPCDSTSHNSSPTTKASSTSSPRFSRFAQHSSYSML